MEISKIEKIDTNAASGWQRYLTLLPPFGAVSLEILYAYFFFQAANAAVEAGLEYYELDEPSIEIISYISTLLFTILNFVGDITAVNPAEIYYKAYTSLKTTEQEETEELPNDFNSECSKVTINYPLKAFTYMNAYTSFCIGASSGAVALAGLVPNKYVQWPLSILATALGTGYYHMLSHDDLVQHHELIYKHLLSSRYSILFNIIKSPLKSLEVALLIGFNTLNRSVGFAYNVNEIIEQNIPNAGQITLYLIGIAAATTAYATIFTRFIGTFNKFFNPKFDMFSWQDRKQVTFSKKDFLLSTLLAAIRVGGISYFVYNHGPNSFIMKVCLTSTLAVSLLAHNLYVNGIRLLNERVLEQNSWLVTTPVKLQTSNSFNRRNSLVFATTIINLGSRSIRLLGFLGFLVTLDLSLNKHNIKTDLNFTDLLIIALAVGVPISINDYLYFENKLTETFDYHLQKLTAEKRKPVFGTFCCLFRSKNEYPRGYFDQERPLSCVKLEKEDEIDQEAQKHLQPG